MYEELIETKEETSARIAEIKALYETNPEVISDILAEFLGGEL